MQGCSQPFFPFKRGPRCKAKIGDIMHATPKLEFHLQTGYTSFIADDQ